MNDVNIGSKRGYHHGNLARTLVDVATELAAEHGPDAVVLREVARRVGVSPAAAYRHFAGQEEILAAVKDRAVAELGDQMRTRVAAESDPAERVLAAGRAYFRFATTQPGLFACLVRGAGPQLQGLEPKNPLGQLVELVRALPRDGGARDDSDPGSVTRDVSDQDGAARDASDRDAAVALWASVHGLSMLCSGGALAGVDAAAKERMLQATLQVALRGVCSLGAV